MKPRRPTPNRSMLSDRDLAVIGDISSFRALTGNQIRRLHFTNSHGDGSSAGALRSSQRTLKRLCDNGILTTIPRRVGGVRAGSAGLTYVLGYHGQRLVRPDRRARTPESLGDRYVAHTLATAEIAVTLHERARDGDIEVIEVQAEPDCWRAFTHRRRTVILKPDIFVAVGVGELEHHWFVELDMATESLVRVRTKCQTYLDYLATGIETDIHGVFPKVAWVVPDQHRADQVTSVIDTLPAPASDMFTVTVTANTLSTLLCIPTVVTTPAIGVTANVKEVTDSNGQAASGGQR